MGIPGFRIAVVQKYQIQFSFMSWQLEKQGCAHLPRWDLEVLISPTMHPVSRPRRALRRTQQHVWIQVQLKETDGCISRVKSKLRIQKKKSMHTWMWGHSQIFGFDFVHWVNWDSSLFLFYFSTDWLTLVKRKLGHYIILPHNALTSSSVRFSANR